MAVLNPEAPEFVSANTIFSYIDPLSSSPYRFLPDTLHQPPFYDYPSSFFPYYTQFPVAEISPCLSIFYNSNYYCLNSSPRQQLNSSPPLMLPSPSPVVASLPYPAITDQAVTAMKLDYGKVKPREVCEKGGRFRFCSKRGIMKEGFLGHGSHSKSTWRPKSETGAKPSGRKLESKADSTQVHTASRSWGMKVARRLQPKPNLFEVEPVENGGKKTTLMIRNIPNKYTREMLLVLLDEHCLKENQKKRLSDQSAELEESLSSAFDFVYLPMDFGTKCNKGYAFVNFTDPQAAWKLHLSLHNHKWGILGTKKICELTYARIQGKEALVKHFQNSNFECESDDYLPVYFIPARDGSGESVSQHTVGKRISSF